MGERDAMVLGQTIGGTFVCDGGLTITEALARLRGNDIAGSVYVAIAHQTAVTEGELDFETGEYQFKMTSFGMGDTMAMAARISELEAHIDKGQSSHCRHTGYGGHQPFHGGHGHGFDGHDEADETECRLSPEETEINRLLTEYAALQIDVDRRVAEAVAAEQAAVVSWIDKRLQSVRDGIIKRLANGYGPSLPWMRGEEKALMGTRSAVTAGKHAAAASAPTTPS